MPSGCKVCVSPDRPEIDRYFSDGMGVRSIARWTEDIGRPISRPTLGRHLVHAIDDRSALVAAAPTKTIHRATSTEFLEAVVAIGAQKVVDNPEKVSIDHSIRSAAILEQKKDDGKSALKVLVLALTGKPLPATIEGEFRELPG